jgi:hypothetical protein
LIPSRVNRIETQKLNLYNEGIFLMDGARENEKRKKGSPSETIK